MGLNLRISEKARQSLVSIFKFLLVFLALDVFFVSIGLLGSFKDIGQGYGQQLMVQLASNPMVGLVIGVLVTSIIQSSSATTSLVVALIAGGTFGDDPQVAIRLAIPIIMGANIGTTITSILVSLGSLGRKKEFEKAFKASTLHDYFNILSVIVIFPVQYFTNFLGHASFYLAKLFENVGGVKFASPLKLVVAPQENMVKSLFSRFPCLIEFVLNFAFWVAALYCIVSIVKRMNDKRSIGLRLLLFAFFLAVAGTLFHVRPNWMFCREMAQFALGLGLLFSALYLIVTSMRSMVIEKFGVLLDSYIFKTDIHAMFAAMILTAAVQSSSVTISVVVPLAGAGILSLKQIYPYALGANLGTTITAILAALATKNVPAIAVAFSHTMFNLIGIGIWYPLKRVPLFLADRVSGWISRSPVLALLYIGSLFFLLPLLLIFIFK
ncbi:MAG: Na/Pi symporter [Pseudomonadota bacterium]